MSVLTCPCYLGDLQELGVDAREASVGEDLGFGEGPEAGMVCGGLVWDQHNDCHQLEALNHAVHASCELGFEKVTLSLTTSPLYSGFSLVP